MKNYSEAPPIRPHDFSNNKKNPKKFKGKTKSLEESFLLETQAKHKKNSTKTSLVITPKKIKIQKEII